MFLFIFDNIHAQELILIGIVALIFLGPRRMPEMARKIGKMMTDFRKATSEFRATWEREVNFEQEERALRTGDYPQPVVRSQNGSPGTPSVPEVKAVDAEEVRSMLPVQEKTNPPDTSDQAEASTGKRDWL